MKPAKTYSIRCSNAGVRVDLCNVGASIQRLILPSTTKQLKDAHNTNLNNYSDDVVLGFDEAEDYLTKNTPYFGVIVGRVANRIKRGRFDLNGTKYELECNNGPNHLHGGFTGFSHRIWDLVEQKEHSVVFEMVSADGDQGYPGEVRVRVSYSLCLINNNHHTTTTTAAAIDLKVEMTAELLSDDKATPINLAQHSYFNLGGHSNTEGIRKHTLVLNAVGYSPIDNTSIPTGDIYYFDSTNSTCAAEKVMNVTTLREEEGMTLGRHLRDFGIYRAGLSIEEAEDICITNNSNTYNDSTVCYKGTNDPYGYDHNYVVRRDQKHQQQQEKVLVSEKSTEEVLNMVGTLCHIDTGRKVTVFSDQPGVQLYTSNYLDGSIAGKDGVKYNQWQGVCLETQSFPNSIIDSNSKAGDTTTNDDTTSFSKGACCILSPVGASDSDYKGARRSYSHTLVYRFEMIQADCK